MKNFSKTLILTAATLLALAPTGVKSETPARVELQPGSVKLQPGSIKVPSGKVKMPTDVIELQPGSIKVQPGSINIAPLSNVVEDLTAPNEDTKRDHAKDRITDGKELTNAEFTNLINRALSNSALFGPNGAVKGLRETAKTELGEQGSEIDTVINDLIVTPLPVDFFPAPPVITPQPAIMPTATAPIVPGAIDAVDPAAVE